LEVCGSGGGLVVEGSFCGHRQAIAVAKIEQEKLERFKLTDDGSSSIHDFVRLCWSSMRVLSRSRKNL